MPFGIALAGVGRSLLGGIFGKRSVYKFVPGHPPGSFRGAGALADYNRRMRELGLSSRAITVTNQRPSIVSSALAMITPGVLQKLSPVMPGGAVVSGGGAGGMPTARKRRKRRAASTRRRAPKRRSRRRKLSAKQIAAGFGGRRRRRRR